VLGYAFGDRLLQAVAQRLRPHASQAPDLVARVGGNEFALLLHGADPTRALKAAQTIVQAFEAPLELNEQTVDLSAALGIACRPGHAADADGLLNRAEIAMYAAKRTLSVVQLYDPALDSSSAQTLTLLGDLRRAVEQGYKASQRLAALPELSGQAEGGAAQPLGYPAAGDGGASPGRESAE